jgi:sortase A
MRRATRRLGTLLAAAGVLLVAYAAVTVLWRDPLTDLYARWRQSQLSSELERTFSEFRAENRQPPAAAGADDRARQRAIAVSARRFRSQLELGQPLGRIVVPRLAIDPVFLHGTRWGPDLSRGPGHYERTSLPGLGGTTAIAGHRTTFGAPFRHIDEIERGDEIVLELPYGTFRYRVFAHDIVQADDWSVVRRRGFDTVVLTACHPLYSAAQRWVVYGRLAEVEPVAGDSYEVQAAAATDVY